MKFSFAIDRDANRQIISSNKAFRVSKIMTFAGETTDDPGDYDGEGNPATLFTVTGDVIAVVFGICDTDLDGDTATIEVGVVDGTALLIPQTTATDIDTNEVWMTNTPTLTAAIADSQIIGNGQDIIQTVATADITAGVITYYCLWRPLSSNGKVVAA